MEKSSRTSFSRNSNQIDLKNIMKIFEIKQLAANR